MMLNILLHVPSLAGSLLSCRSAYLYQWLLTCFLLSLAALRCPAELYEEEEVLLPSLVNAWYCFPFFLPVEGVYQCGDPTGALHFTFPCLLLSVHFFMSLLLSLLFCEMFLLDLLPIFPGTSS